MEPHSDRTEQVQATGGVVMMNPKELRHHPEQYHVYGNEDDTELLESVKKHGILQNLVVTKKDKIIVSGFRRCCVAKRLGLKEVPVAFFPSDDPLDAAEALVAFNRYRTKSKSQIAREADFLREIGLERNLRDKQEGGRKGGLASGAARRGEPKHEALVPHASTTQGRQPQSREKIGQALGIGAKADDAAAKVGKAIREFEEAGDEENAEKLKAPVNEKGYIPTAREIEAAAEQGERSVLDDHPVGKAQSRLNKAIARYNAALRAVRQAYQGLLAEIDKDREAPLDSEASLDSKMVIFDVKLKLPKELDEVSAVEMWDTLEMA